MNHLEKLIRQYYEWKGYIVRGNVKVGQLPLGGYAGELDIVAYHPLSGHLVHIEPSLSDPSWKEKEERYKKKFVLGKQYIHKAVFPWLSAGMPIEQIAVLVRNTRPHLAGGIVKSVDEIMKEIKDEILKHGIMAKHAIPEEFDLLRTIQMAVCGYYKVV
jgi:hypothetical protein